MGNAGRHVHVPTRPLPPPPAAESIAVREATIPPGGELTARWLQLQRYRRVAVGVENVGSGPCEFDGREGEVHVVRSGETAAICLPDGLEEFLLHVRSLAGTQVRLSQVARSAAPPRRFGVRKTVLRDPKTQLITSVVEEAVWLEP